MVAEKLTRRERRLRRKLRHAERVNLLLYRAAFPEVVEAIRVFAFVDAYLDALIERDPGSRDRYERARRRWKGRLAALADRDEPTDFAWIPVLVAALSDGADPKDAA